MDSLYSALVLDADAAGMPSPLRLFDYSQSMNVPGGQSSTVLATAAHTNVPRPGMSGLPVHWEFFISRWRVTTNLRIDEPLMDWAAETSARLYYHNKCYSTVPLLDLLMAPRAFYDLDAEDSVIANGRLWIRENLSYWVEIMTQPKATEQLQEFLLQHTRSHRMILWVYFDGTLRKDVS